MVGARGWVKKTVPMWKNYGKTMEKPLNISKYDCVSGGI
jgi:hypothetical protein